MPEPAAAPAPAAWRRALAPAMAGNWAVFALAALALAASWLAEEPEAYLFPRLVSALLAVFAVVNLWRAVKGKDEEKDLNRLRKNLEKADREYKSRLADMKMAVEKYEAALMEKAAEFSAYDDEYERMKKLVAKLEAALKSHSCPECNANLKLKDGVLVKFDGQAEKRAEEELAHARFQLNALFPNGERIIEQQEIIQRNIDETKEAVGDYKREFSKWRETLSVAAAEKSAGLPPALLRQIAPGAGLIVVFVSVAETAGFYFSSFFVYFALAYAYNKGKGARAALVCAAVAVVVVLLLYAVFSVLLQVQTPRGWLV